MDSIKGYVEHIVYRNEDNGYTVFNLNNDDGEMTCVGNFHYIEEGELLKLQGEYTTHKLYGLQFKAEQEPKFIYTPQGRPLEALTDFLTELNSLVEE